MHGTKRSVATQTSTTDIPIREGRHFRTPDTIVILVSLGSREDEEIDSVISNIEFLRGSMHTSRDKDVVAVYPFSDSKTRTLTQLRNPADHRVGRYKTFLIHFKRCIVALIGSRYTTESDDCFGAVSAEKLNGLLGMQNNKGNVQV